MNGDPYTHAMHAQACQIAARARQTLTQWVQVKTSGSACCARILDGWTSADGHDFWKVQSTDPLPFTGSYPVRAVRQCSGLDGRCTCAGEPGLAGKALQAMGYDLEELERDNPYNQWMYERDNATENVASETSL